MVELEEPSGLPDRGVCAPGLLGAKFLEMPHVLWLWDGTARTIVGRVHALGAGSKPWSIDWFLRRQTQTNVTRRPGIDRTVCARR